MFECASADPSESPRGIAALETLAIRAARPQARLIRVSALAAPLHDPGPQWISEARRKQLDVSDCWRGTGDCWQGALALLRVGCLSRLTCAVIPLEGWAEALALAERQDAAVAVLLAPAGAVARGEVQLAYPPASASVLGVAESEIMSAVTSTVQQQQHEQQQQQHQQHEQHQPSLPPPAPAPADAFNILAEAAAPQQPRAPPPHLGSFASTSGTSYTGTVARVPSNGSLRALPDSAYYSSAPEDSGADDDASEEPRRPGAYFHQAPPLVEGRFRGGGYGASEAVPGMADDGDPHGPLHATASRGQLAVAAHTAPDPAPVFHAPLDPPRRTFSDAELLRDDDSSQGGSPDRTAAGPKGQGAGALASSPSTFRNTSAALVAAAASARATHRTVASEPSTTGRGQSPLAGLATLPQTSSGLSIGSEEEGLLLPMPLPSPQQQQRRLLAPMQPAVVEHENEDDDDDDDEDDDFHASQPQPPMQRPVSMPQVQLAHLQQQPAAPAHQAAPPAQLALAYHPVHEHPAPAAPPAAIALHRFDEPDEDDDDDDDDDVEVADPAPYSAPVPAPAPPVPGVSPTRGVAPQAITRWSTPASDVSSDASSEAASPALDQRHSPAHGSSAATGKGAPHASLAHDTQPLPLHPAAAAPILATPAPLPTPDAVPRRLASSVVSPTQPGKILAAGGGAGSHATALTRRFGVGTPAQPVVAASDSGMLPRSARRSFTNAGVVAPSQLPLLGAGQPQQPQPTQQLQIVAVPAPQQQQQRGSGGGPTKVRRGGQPPPQSTPVAQDSPPPTPSCPHPAARRPPPTAASACLSARPQPGPLAQQHPQPARPRRDVHAAPPPLRARRGGWQHRHAAARRAAARTCPRCWPWTLRAAVAPARATACAGPAAADAPGAAAVRWAGARRASAGTARSGRHRPAPPPPPERDTHRCPCRADAAHSRVPRPRRALGSAGGLGVPARAAAAPAVAHAPPQRRPTLVAPPDWRAAAARTATAAPPLGCGRGDADASRRPRPGHCRDVARKARFRFCPPQGRRLLARRAARPPGTSACSAVPPGPTHPAGGGGARARATAAAATGASAGCGGARASGLGRAGRGRGKERGWRCCY